MRVVQLQQSARAVVSGLSRTSTTPCLGQLAERFGALRVGGLAPNAGKIEGRRYASVKSQGAYRLPNKKTIAKKLGAKKTGDMYVIPGNIIYKQRGTLWFPGENVGMGRDHTLFALASGYVKYYKDPQLHPKRQYIGVVFNKEDVLPYPRHAMRKRKLNMTPVPIQESEPLSELSPSGIPNVVERISGKKGGTTRIFKLKENYAYREDNFALGNLVETAQLKKRKLKRRWSFKIQRRKREALYEEAKQLRHAKKLRRIETVNLQHAAKVKKAIKQKKYDAKHQGGSVVPPPAAKGPTAQPTA